MKADNTAPTHSLLLIDKQEFKKQIEERLEVGYLLIHERIQTDLQEDNWWKRFIDWNSYNEEMFKQAFDKPDNDYFKEYEKGASFVMPISFGGDYRPLSFSESVASNREEMKEQIEKLKRIHGKIDLLRSSVNRPKSNKLEPLILLLKNFHKVAQELRERNGGKEALIIESEYDVQFLLNALLHIYFDDVRKEDYSPRSAGGNSIIDFTLKKEGIIIEVKMSSSRLGAKQLGEQLLIDIGRYKEYPNSSDLVIFIYDKGDYVRNKKGLIRDLEKQSTPDLKVTVIITPE